MPDHPTILQQERSTRLSVERLRAFAASRSLLVSLFAMLAHGQIVPALDPKPPESSTNSLAMTIPIQFVRERVMLPIQVNGSKPLSFMLDTGYGISIIHPDLVGPLGLKRVGNITIVGIAGREEAGTYGGAVFDFGKASYAPRRVASLPSEAQTSRRRRDGILGAGFFRRFVVEIDSKNKKLLLHEPEAFSYRGRGEILALQFEEDTPIVEAAIAMPKRGLLRGRFEVDTGCDDCLCLGHDFLADNRLLEEIEGLRPGTKQGVGGDARIRHGHVQQLQLGRLTLDDPTANFFLDGSPVDKGLAGHIGMAALRPYKVIFDYLRHQMILEPTP